MVFRKSKTVRPDACVLTIETVAVVRDTNASLAPHRHPQPRHVPRTRPSKSKRELVSFHRVENEPVVRASGDGHEAGADLARTGVAPRPLKPPPGMNHQQPLRAFLCQIPVMQAGVVGICFVKNEITSNLSHHDRRSAVVEDASPKRAKLYVPFDRVAAVPGREAAQPQEKVARRGDIGDD